jgi:hypothetical protein
VSVSLPILLALAGTVLMAIAIFGPFRAAGSAERAEPERAPAGPHWPELVEPSATMCDVHARLDLVDALASIASPWALDVLHHAHDEEPDPAVRTAIDAALAAVTVPEPTLVR